MTAKSGPAKEQTDSIYPKKRWMLVWIAIRVFGLAFFLLATVLNLISGVLSAVLIVAFVLCSNLALRPIAKLSYRSTLLYATYAAGILALLALWFFSIINFAGVLVVLAPLALGYLVLSHSKKFK